MLVEQALPIRGADPWGGAAAPCYGREQDSRGLVRDGDAVDVSSGGGVAQVADPFGRVLA
jgi:hypothetical protein